MSENTNVNTVNTTVQSQDKQTPDVSTTPVQDGNTSTTPAPITEFEIDGLGKVKVDDIKEWKQGYMRQSDYTKKTQSIAQQRKEMQQAIEVFEYLKANPQVANALANGQPVQIAGTPLANVRNSETEYLNSELAALKLDIELRDLKSKYKDFDEIAVLKKAEELGTYDLEFVYKGLKGESTDTNSLTQEIRRQIESELMAKIQQNNSATQTIISPTDQTANENYGLTPEEIALCDKAGWDKEAYAKNKIR
jgi:hypothetical protein